MYERRLRPLFFRLEPEQAHGVTLGLLTVGGPVGGLLLRAVYGFKHPALTTHAFGLTFNNPVGLAAGYDKNGQAVSGLAGLGFGHLELGTVTVQPQVGNPQPRIFRLPENQALINRMGFPNGGLNRLLRRIPRTARLPLGVNIGKGKDTPLGQAYLDYVQLLMAVYDRADYIAINISSPNTLNLRQLQAKHFLNDLIGRIMEARDRQAKSYSVQRPVLVKIAPDLTWAEIDDVLAVCQQHAVDGVIATNTTIMRPGINGPYRREAGGLSGAPLRAHSTEVVRYIYQRMGPKLPIVGVGGVDSAEAALEKIRAGAVLVQLYTGMIYRGPGLVQEINRGLAAVCEREGVRRIGDLVGVAAS